MEEARNRLNFRGAIIQVEGKRGRSYDELVDLFSQESYAHKEFVDVVLMRPITGGEGTAVSIIIAWRIYLSVLKKQYFQKRI